MAGRVESVLVVDDHEATVAGLRQLLQASNYQVYATTTGRDAVRMACDHSPDAVLLDVRMPDVSGVEICAELKHHAATRLIPIVLMSGERERATRIAGLAAGADDFVVKPVDIEELRIRLRSLIRLKRTVDELESAEALFLALGRMIEARDPYTEGHCERLARYATLLGASLGLDGADLDTLYRGAFLHDVGKIAIPDRVLLKRGRFTAGEYGLMKRHPVTGEELCRTVRSFHAVCPIVRHHHERLDGRGYPDGLTGDAIPRLAQIVTIADVFDALTTDRPYRRKLSPARALATMRAEARAGAYSPALVERFTECVARTAIVRPKQKPPRFSRLSVQAPSGFAARGCAATFLEP